MRPTETETVSQASRCGAKHKIRCAMQVGAGHWAAKVSNARWRGREWRSERGKERQLQARTIYRRGGCHPPLATRGRLYAPQAERVHRMTTETTESSAGGK